MEQWCTPCRVCDKVVARAIEAYADEVHGGEWDEVTVQEMRGIVAVLEEVRR